MMYTLGKVYALYTAIHNVYEVHYIFVFACMLYDTYFIGHTTGIFITWIYLYTVHCIGFFVCIALYYILLYYLCILDIT